MFVGFFERWERFPIHVCMLGGSTGNGGWRDSHASLALVVCGESARMG